MLEIIIGIINLILFFIIFFAILKIRDNTTEMKDILFSLLKLNRGEQYKDESRTSSDESEKTRKFIEILEKTKEKRKNE